MSGTLKKSLYFSNVIYSELTPISSLTITHNSFIYLMIEETVSAKKFYESMKNKMTPGPSCMRLVFQTLDIFFLTFVSITFYSSN